jgi:hypothetical protein
MAALLCIQPRLGCSQHGVLVLLFHAKDLALHGLVSFFLCSTKIHSRQSLSVPCCPGRYIRMFHCILKKVYSNRFGTWVECMQSRRSKVPRRMVLLQSTKGKDCGRQEVSTRTLIYRFLTSDFQMNFCTRLVYDQGADLCKFMKFTNQTRETHVASIQCLLTVSTNL